MLKRGISGVVSYCPHAPAVLFLLQITLTMKTKILLILIVTALVVQSCSRAISPYQAANNPRGKHCRDIK